MLFKDLDNVYAHETFGLTSENFNPNVVPEICVFECNRVAAASLVSNAVSRFWFYNWFLL